MGTKDNLPVLGFDSQASWEDWLSEHHSDPKGIWLKIAKKGSGIRSVSYAEALETALIYGWIDSQKQTYDDKYFVQRFTPRGPRSVWSQTNKDSVSKLISTGRIKPSGMRQVELAKANGEWDRAYEPQSQITVPADFQSELDKNGESAKFFATLSSTNRYAILFRIQTAKKPETRAARIKQFVEMLSRKETLHS